MTDSRKYKKTIDATVFTKNDFLKLRVGQWVKILDLTGQYMGVTHADIVTINYKKADTMKLQFKSNKPLRQFAKIMGAN
jgi:hypothetical protein